MEPSYKLTEAAEVTGRSRVTIRRYLDRGRFPRAFRAGGDGADGPWEIPASDLRAAGLTIRGDTGTSSSANKVDTGDTTDTDGRLRAELAVAQALAVERARTIEMLSAQLEQLQETLRAAIAARAT